MNEYRCRHCGKVYTRDSRKMWIPSFCEKTGRNVRLHLDRDATGVNVLLYTVPSDRNN